MADLIRKAQPTQSDVHVNAPLSNISIAYIQSQGEFIADKVFPTVYVDKQTDLFWKYTKHDWFRDEAKLRGPSTESAGGGYNVSTDSYACNVYAFHKDIPDQVRANADMMDVDRDASLFVTHRLLLRREKIWAENYFATSKWGKDYTGVAAGEVAGTSFRQWSDYSSSDPVSDIKTGKLYIKGTTGYRPNTLVLGEEVFESLKNHPDIIDRYKYTQSNVITVDMLARLFEVDRILIAGAVYSADEELKTTPTYTWVMGKGALLVYAAPNPSLLTPSGGYTFAWKGLTGLGFATAISKFRMQNLKSDRVEGESAYDCKLVANDMGVYFATAIV
jgi:hypothetical protein